jgi:hypothetical protein
MNVFLTLAMQSSQTTFNNPLNSYNFYDAKAGVGNSFFARGSHWKQKWPIRASISTI